MQTEYAVPVPKATQINNTKEQENTPVKRPISIPSIETNSKKASTSSSSIASKIDNKKSASDTSDSSDSEPENISVKAIVKSNEIKHSNSNATTLNAKHSLNKVKSDEVNSVSASSSVKVKKTLLPNPKSCIEIPSRINSDDTESFSNENNVGNNCYNKNSRNSNVSSV